MGQADVIVYQWKDETHQQIKVIVEDETVWLSQTQMVELFASSKQNISLHINNVYKENELEEKATVKESLTVQKEGSRKVKRKVKLYNLDVIISVGYRVKSRRRTQFRVWAIKVLKEYLLKGYALNHRVDRLGLYNYLRKQQIFAEIHYIPCHLMPYYRAFGWKEGDCATS